MTTTVKRGAGRPAATEKTNRHAQRTPLPPKAGQVEDAKDVIAAAEAGVKMRAARAGARRRPKANPEDVERTVRELEGKLLTPPRYGEMKQAELLEVARGLGLTPPKSAPKGRLLTAILQAEQAQRAEAKVDAALKPSKLDAKLDAAFNGGTITTTGRVAEVHKRLDSKSGAKAEAFVAEALRLGWQAGATLAAGDLVTVTATRGEEVITIQWLGGVFQDNCSYRHNGRTPIKLRNASAAKQRMAVPAATANEEAAKVTAHKAVRAKAEKATPGHRRPLPFTEASLDQEVLDAVYGKRVTWVNRISEAEEEDRVPAPAEGVRLGDGTRGVKKQHHAPHITEGPRGRVLNFVGANGFKSVALAQITRVR